MKTKLIFGAVAAAVAVFSQGAFAQASSPTRAEVKAEARTGAAAPAGEGPNLTGQHPSKTSTKSRMERKAKTRAEAKAGKLEPAGQAAEPVTPSASAAVTTRAERKATTRAAAKAGELKPAGEAAMPAAEPKKK